ncbi:hypothetical protein, partial [Polaromonas sp.]|uniref:hypothetical protein n=1 Tax=Polaromonas sp. TaxID=1869339 RepID=UPI003BB70BE6
AGRTRRGVDERKNLPEHETLIRRYCATTPKPKSKFTELMLLYQKTATSRRLVMRSIHRDIRFS